MRSRPPGKILFARKDKLLCLRLEGRITCALGPGFTDFIGKIFADVAWSEIVVDLTGTAAMDSTALGLLAKIARLLRQRRDQSLTVVSTNDKITDTLHHVGMERLMTIVGPTGRVAEGLEELPEREASRSDNIRIVLDAHRELMALSEKNAAEFTTVVELLEEELHD